MQIRGSSGSIWLDVLERYPGDPAPAGEVELCLDVSSSGFVGRMFPWVKAAALQEFLSALEAMQARRTGSAVLPGITADFGLRFAWEERPCGVHLAATGKITSYADYTDGGPHTNVLQFGMDLPSGSLPDVVTGIRALIQRAEQVAAEFASRGPGTNQ